MSRIALYVRVSTASQESEGQVLQLREWAEAQGHTIVKVYQDQESGARRRESLDDLMADAHRGRFDMVAFWKLDRLSREGVLATLLYLDNLNRAGIGIYSHQETFLDPRMPFYSVLVAFVAELARMEREAISERTKMGLERARRAGKRLGRHPKDCTCRLHRKRGVLAQAQRDTPGNHPE